jgi:GLPGLI family protein
MRRQSLFNIKSYFSLIVIFTLLILSSCSNISFSNGVDEGVIEYDITYPTIAEDNFMLDLMPKNMRTTFVKNNYRSDIIAGMGIFKTSIISTNGSDKLVHSIKMLKTKYASELTDEDFKTFNPAFNKVEVKLADDVKQIAGYTCKSADVTVVGDSVWTFKVYYTNEIKIKNANGHTPFNAIDGVLMEYELFSNNILMKFTAKKVVQEKVELSDIELEDDYEMVEPLKLKSEIQKLFANIM